MLAVNVIGFVSGNLGLGVFARAVVALLNRRGFQVRVFDVDPGFGRQGQDNTFSSQFVDSPAVFETGLNLFILATPELRSIIARYGSQFVGAAALNVAMPMWELPNLPRGWSRVFECFDAVAAATPFIRFALETNVSNVAFVDSPIPVVVPEKTEGDRSRFELPAEKILFYAAFEPLSDPERKNALGAIQAFRMAGLAPKKSHLLIKINNAAAVDRNHASIVALRDAAGGASNISFLSKQLEKWELETLHASVDCFISLHRAEGLGLVAMEGMMLGKPVIATAWSGNMAFMDHLSGCLVDYRLIPVRRSGGAYKRLMRHTPATWAEPNLEAAAEWIGKLAIDDGLRRKIGEAGRSRIIEYNRRAESAQFIDELLAIAGRCDTLKVAKRRAHSFNLVKMSSRRGLKATIERMVGRNGTR